MIRVSPISTEEYVATVLPQSATLWAGDRDFDTYANDFLELAGSGFGQRRLRTLGVRIDGAIVTSCKRYSREMRMGTRDFSVAAIGAVFTPQSERGRGYATAFLGALLDRERANGTDCALLFSDIHPVFYERLGFVQLPSRVLNVRADALPAARLPSRALTDSDWPAVQRCFAALDARREFALTRPPLVREYTQARVTLRERTGTVVRLGIVRARSVLAYVIGRRYPQADTFALDEMAYADDASGLLLPALVRNAAGDLRKVAGWLPPVPARDMLPRGAARKRTTGIAMIAPLSPAMRSAWSRDGDAITTGRGDPFWNADHV